MTRQFAVHYLDPRGSVDHNAVGTVEDIFAMADGRPFVVIGEVTYSDQEKQDEET